MPLQNVRALLWRGEDLGYGGGNTRELITSTQVAASARPLLITQSFTLIQDITAYLGLTVASGVRGQLRVIMNRSPRYFITLNAVVNGLPVQMPIAPLQNLYLPQNVVGPATLTANTTWPIPIPITGASGAVMRTANGTTALTFDLMVEQ